METTMTVQPEVININDLPIERQLEVAGSVTVGRARELRVTSQADYEDAARFLQDIKSQAKRIKDYWAEPKQEAAATHKRIVAREKAMLQPLTDAESIVKKTMGTYLAAVSRARREAEEAARKQREEEAARLLQNAIDAEQSGDDQAAAINLAMAEMVTDMPAPQTIDQPKAAGVSTRKQWKATVTDPDKVPVSFNGMEIRHIDLSVLNTIARMTKGTASIPGVTFTEESTLAIRS